MDEIRARRMSDELIGKSIGQWEIVEYLGNGKSALVFKGKFKGEERAVKVFDPELVQRFGKENQLKRIQRELLLRGRNHKHLINIFDGGECKSTGYLYIVMNCLEFLTLEDVGKNIPYNQISQVIEQIASAAQYLESLELCHRDIKPSNILITSDYKNAILLDLGVLKPIGNSDLTDEDSHQFIGTLRYSSPEFLMRNEVDNMEGWRAVTFYQIGAVIHDLIMKKPLFDEYSDPYARLVEAVKNVTPVVESNDVSPQLIQLAKTCLIKDPITRLRLLDWGSFTITEQPSFADIKKRVRHRNIAVQSSGANLTQPDDVTRRRYSQVLDGIISKIEGVIRSKCVGNNDFPPIEIAIESAALMITFPASPSHNLPLSLNVCINMEILDAETESIILRYWSALSKEKIKSPQITNTSLYQLYSGVYHESIINDKIEKFLYLLLDAAQQQTVRFDLEIIPIGSLEEWEEVL